MNDLITVKRPADWQRMKDLVLNSVSSPITRRVYDMVLNEFMDWYQQAPRPGFSKATVSAWRASLEARKLGSSSIIIRMSAIRKLAGEAADNGLLAPELAAGIARVKSVKSTGIRTGFPDTCVIYDSRVAAALTSILDPAMCLISDSPEWQEYSRLGTISGRGGSRPRNVSWRWPIGYGTWASQMAANLLCRKAVEQLNRQPIARSDYHKFGDCTPWTLREVEAVLFMEGY